MINIPESEYRELQRCREDLETICAWNSRKGNIYRKLIWLREFDKYATKQFPAYPEMKKEFTEECKNRQGAFKC